MDLYLQFGFGMMEHCRYLVEQWAGGTVILSPRDLSAVQLERLSREVIKRGGAVVLDPQLYKVGATHGRLTAHAYWPPLGSRLTDTLLSNTVAKLIKLNREIGAKKIILPSSLADRIDDDWLNNQLLVIEEAQRQGMDDVELVMTVAVGNKAISDDAQVEKLMEKLPSWSVSTIYLVCEPPPDQYLVNNPTWLSNVLDIIAAAKLAGKCVIVGYCNQQMLAASIVGADAIASGTWMNVRSFSADKFDSSDEEDPKKRATWYYAPHVLSEYKVNFLDLAKKIGVLPQLQTSPAFDSPHVVDLFASAQPTLAGFTEQQAFRHFLHCLQRQSKSAVQASFDATVDGYLQTLQTARGTLEGLHKAGIKGQNRDFLDCLDAHEVTVQYIKLNRGPLLRRKWTA